MSCHRCCQCKNIYINAKPSNVGDGVPLVTADRNIKSLKAGNNVQIVNEGNTVLISASTSPDKPFQGKTTTNDNSSALFSIPLEIGQAIAVKFIIIAAEQVTGEIAAYFINAVFKRTVAGIQRVNLPDSSEFIQMVNTTVSFDLSSDVTIMVASTNSIVNWSGSAQVEFVKF